MSKERQTIVVVDDDVAMGKAIERLLSAASYRTVRFQSAEALLAGDAIPSADCFIFDIHLPGISGFELRRQIALRGAVAPVIFITGYEDHAAREESKAAGAIALLAKPFRGQEMLAAIAGALATR